MERRNKIEMLFSSFVVKQRLALECVLDRLPGELAIFGRRGGKFQNVEGGTGITIGVGGNLPQ